MEEEQAKKNYYELLGVPADASAEQIRVVYKELARVYHPDSNFYSEIVPTKVSTEQLELFKIMTAAYNTLTDPEKRAEYDKKLKATMLNLKSWDDDPADDFWDSRSSAAAQAKAATSGRRRKTTGFGRLDTLAEMEQKEARSRTSTTKIEPGQAAKAVRATAAAEYIPRDRHTTGNVRPSAARAKTGPHNLASQGKPSRKRKSMSAVQTLFIAVEVGLMFGVAMALIYY